jgi:hypothetical protein
MLRYDYDNTEISSVRKTWTDRCKALSGEFVVDAFGEPLLKYENSAIRLAIECHTSERYLRVNVIARKGDTSPMQLVIEYGKELVWVVRQFKDAQATLDFKTLPALLSAMIARGVRVFQETKNGLIRWNEL